MDLVEAKLEVVVALAELVLAELRGCIRLYSIY